MGWKKQLKKQNEKIRKNYKGHVSDNLIEKAVDLNTRLTYRNVSEDKRKKEEGRANARRDMNDL